MQKIRKMLTFSIFMFATFYLSVVALMYLLQDRMLFAAPYAPQTELPRGAEWVEIRTKENLVLNAIYISAGKDADQVLFFHGNGSSAIYEMDRGLALNAAGFSVLLAEYPGYGGSQGKPSAASLLSTALDSYQWLENRSKGAIHVYGHSLGSGVAMYVASEREIASVVLEASYDSLENVAAAHYPWLPVRYLFRNNIKTDDFSVNVSAPILFIHGTKDRVIPIRFGRKLHESVAGQADWIELENVGHNDLVVLGSVRMAAEFFRTGKISSPGD